MNFPKIPKEMNIDVRILAGAGAGLLAGGGLAGWLLCRSYMSRVFYERLDTEMDALRLHLLNQYEKDQIMEKVLSPVEAEETARADYLARFAAAEDDRDERDREDAADTGADELGPEDAHPASEPGPDEGDDGVGQDVAVDVGDRVADPRADPIWPYPITAVEFANSDVGWQVLELWYFAEEGVLTDDKGGPIPNVRKTVGIITKEMFGQKEGVPDNVLYVRNEQLEADFEIVRQSQSYPEFLGYEKPK